MEHVLRSAKEPDDVIYCGSEEDKRQWLSVAVAVPIEPPKGSHTFNHIYKFCCKHSCTSGINRRRIAVLFTLEDYEYDILFLLLYKFNKSIYVLINLIFSGEIHGRKSLGVRVCSCPKRDMDKDEEELMKGQVDGPPPHKKMKVMPKKSSQSSDVPSATSSQEDSTYYTVNVSIF